MVFCAGRIRGARNGIQRIFFPHPSAAFVVSRYYNCLPSCHPPPVEGLAITSSYRGAQLSPQARGAPFGLDEKEAARRIRGVISRIINGTVDDVVEWLRRDRDCSEIQLSDSLVDSLFGGFGDDWKSAMGFFRWAALCSGYKHSSGTYNKMVDLLGKMKQLNKMMDLVSEMREAGLVTLETVAKVMRRLAGARRWEDAIKMFDNLGTVGLVKSTDSMNILLDTLCKEKCVDAARGVFLELKAHIPPNAHTFNILVHGWCKANRIDEAEWAILEMKGYGFRPSVITYSTILKAHCKNFSFDRVYKLLDDMHAECCPPNVVTYTIVMHSLAKSEEYEAALKIVDRMRAAGCKPDTLFYNSMIYVLGRAGRLSEASHLFEVDMHLNGVAPNLSTYNTMISIFCYRLRDKDAMKVLEKMENTFCKPDLLTYCPLLKLCFKRGKTDDMLCVLMNDIVNKHHLSLDLATYTLLIHGLCRAGKFEWALLLFEEMVNQEIPLRNRTCNLLLCEAEEKNMYGTVERIKDLIKQARNTSCSDQRIDVLHC
uniref:Pentatricopeptide repeat-containing protein At3g04130, mitochondrial n=1 Tax=Anthurium amnicola TaxID=1678845 RepID=A0A1D1YSX2_9ARAE